MFFSFKVKEIFNSLGVKFTALELDKEGMLHIFCCDFCISFESILKNVLFSPLES